MWLGERVCRKLRLDYFYSLMAQDIGWYDSHQTGDLTTRIVNDSQSKYTRATYSVVRTRSISCPKQTAVQEALSEKTSQSFQQLATFLTGFVIAFIKVRGVCLFPFVSSFREFGILD